MQAPHEVKTNDAPVLNPSPHHVSVTDWLWLAVAILLSLALRIPFFTTPMLSDEGGYAYATRGWVNGTGELYGDLWISRPQGIFFVYAGIFDLFGTGTTAFRFAAWIAIAFTVMAVWGFARMCASPLAANLTALVFAVASALPNLEGYSANAEMFMGLPAALSALWLLRIARTGWPHWQLAGTGVLVGLAISLKPSAAAMYLVAIAFIAFLDNGARPGERLRQSLWLSAGVATVGIGSLIHGWMLGWSDFIYATFTYRLSAQSAATVGLHHNLESIARLIVRTSALIGLTAVLFVLRYRFEIAGIFRSMRPARSWKRPARLAVWGLGTAANRFNLSKLSRPRDDGKFLLRLWMLGSLLGASIGGDWWSHYLIQVIAPLSIWMGWTIAVAWPRLVRPERIVFAAVIAVLLLAPFRVLLHGSPTDMANAMFSFSHPGYPAQEEVAAYLREHSEPGSTIYVTFDLASIYYLADRSPAYRHLYDQELRGIPSSYSDLISIIQSPNRPEYIVSTRQPGPFADDSRAFWQEVGQFYTVVETIDGVPIYQDKDKIEETGG